jgi:hypothetical protein
MPGLITCPAHVTGTTLWDYSEDSTSLNILQRTSVPYSQIYVKSNAPDKASLISGWMMVFRTHSRNVLTSTAFHSEDASSFTMGAGAAVAACCLCICRIISAASAAYLHFILTVSPYLYMMSGNGMQTSVKKAGIDVAQ